MQKIFIFPNFKKANVHECLQQLLDFFHAHNMQVVLPDTCADTYSALLFSKEKKLGFPNLKFAISLGGDGTILRLIKEISPFNIPICGINMGQVGFLADLQPSALPEALNKIINNQYKIQPRKMLKVQVTDGGKDLYCAHALNDIVLTREHDSQMLRLYVHLSDDSCVKYPVDGLIFSTSTGSTAYSLSAGGPIIHPSLEATLITPICAYAMYTKPMVTSSQEVITIKFAANSGTSLIIADGITVGQVRFDYTLTISPSEYQATFIKITTPDYYPTWQERLRRGEESTNF